MRPTLILASALLLIIFVAGWVGGQAFPFDHQTVAFAGLWRIGHPELAGAVIWLTHLGGSFIVVPMVLITAGWLWFKDGRRNALLLLATTLSGRAAIELIKLLVDRPRPSLERFPVYVSSQSFPSGHAGNSTVTYLALALFALPERWRREGLVAAALLALAIGASRPVLGVHWPTDVIGGWAFGLLWILLWSWISRRPSA